MSSLAEDPENIRRILLTKEYNPAGAYQIRLCRAGQWHCVLIDDVLPTDGLSCLAYLKAARRSLWGPLIEKAAAKLHGSYEALNGGSFAEAFGMLTGCPVQRVVLSRYREPKGPPAGSPPEATASYEKQLMRWRSKKLDFETLYAQLYSFKASGFAMGASTFFGTGASTSGGMSADYAELIQEARAKGLQFPHAYAMLEFAEVGGEELVKLRNPNGHAGWRGAWGKGSAKWTYDLKQELGIEREDSGVFWMAWSDFTRLFAEITVCRLLPNHMEARQGGWLPSVFGAGQVARMQPTRPSLRAPRSVPLAACRLPLAACRLPLAACRLPLAPACMPRSTYHWPFAVLITGCHVLPACLPLVACVTRVFTSDPVWQALTMEVFAHSRVELALHQEPHSDRGEKAISSLVDLGFVVMKQGGDGSLTLVTHSERIIASQVCASATLEQDDFTTKYVVLPLCFGHMRSSEPRKFALSCHSTMPITIEPVQTPPKMLATAAIQLAMAEGESQALLSHPVFGEMLKLWTLDDEGGYFIVAENLSSFHIRVEVDASERTSGFVSSRGALFSQDVRRPSHDLNARPAASSTLPGTCTDPAIEHRHARPLDPRERRLSALCFPSLRRPSLLV